MRKNIQLIMMSILVCFFTACLKDDNSVKIEQVKKGEKWGIRIGSTPEQVYQQIQQAGSQKNFDMLSLVYRKASNDPSLLPENLGAYNYLKFQRQEEGEQYVTQVYLHFSDNKVSKIQFAKDEWNDLERWPEEEPANLSIQSGEETSTVYEKLQQLYGQENFSSYYFSLSDKPLDRTYDPKMELYTEWAFFFTEDSGNPNPSGTETRLYFEKNKLSKMQITYRTYEPVLD